MYICHYGERYNVSTHTNKNKWEFKKYIDENSTNENNDEILTTEDLFILFSIDYKPYRIISCGIAKNGTIDCTGNVHTCPHNVALDKLAYGGDKKKENYNIKIENI